MPKLLQEQRIHLTISGMSCAGCVANIEQALSSVPGVTAVSVNFVDHTAWVATTGQIPVLIDAVDKVGYQAKVSTGANDQKQSKADLSRTLRLMLLRSTLSLGLASTLMLDKHWQCLPGPENVTFWLLMGCLVWVVMWVSGSQFFHGAIQAARHRSMTMDTLVALATGTTWIFSMSVLVRPEVVSVAARHLFFESGLFIIGFVNLGKALESYAIGSTSLAIQKLLNLSPKTALKIQVDNDIRVPVSCIAMGDYVRVYPGDSIPVDGRVIAGRSVVNEAMFSGESMPANKVAGDRVFAGTLNLQGVLTLVTTEVGSTTAVAQMAAMVQAAQYAKPKVAILTNKIASVLVPSIVLLALVTALVWWGWNPTDLSFAVTTSLSVLIIACPCALGLAVPLSIMIGIGRSASLGVLVKNGDTLQMASRLTTIVMDKTGTLTQGEPDVTGIMGECQNKLLQIAVGLAQGSAHPLAQSIVKYARQDKIQPLAVTGHHSTPGGGVKGYISGNICGIGSYAYLRNLGMQGERQLATGTQVYVGCQQQILGHIELNDPLKPDVKKMVAKLRSMGLKLAILTGDNQVAAEHVARQLAVTEVKWDCKPSDKLAYLQQRQRLGERIGMVGDGINDAPALSVADVGFAIGQGTDIALDSADVVLMSGSLNGIIKSRRLAKLTMVNIYQNLCLAFIYNLLLIPLAAGVFYPSLGLLISPVFAGLAMSLSSMTVVANALTLYLRRLS